MECHECIYGAVDTVKYEQHCKEIQKDFIVCANPEKYMFGTCPLKNNITPTAPDQCPLGTEGKKGSSERGTGG